jgi:predicted TIM-barrel fold metal-dependent hydrolase
MIDAHIHIFPPYRSVKAVRWLKRYIQGLRVEETVNETQILKLLQDSGISHFFNYVYPIKQEESRPLNEYNYHLSKRVKNAVCFGSLHPDNEDRKDILEEALIGYGLLGIKFHPFVQGFSVLDPRLDEIYVSLEKMERPLVIHTGFDRFYKATIRVEEVETILKRHPDLVMVIAHMFYPEVRRAFQLLKQYPNVYLDGTNLFSDYQEGIEGENIFEGVCDAVNGNPKYRISCLAFRDELEQYSDRILLGSDYPVAMNDPEKIYAYMNAIPLSNGAKSDLLWGTAQRFVEKYNPNFFQEC